MSRSIAFFDFDGTITTKDTLLEFITFVKGPSALNRFFVRYGVMLVLMKLKLVSNQHAKGVMLSYFFKGTSLEQFNQWCREFSRQRLPELVRPQAIAEIRRLQGQGTQVVIVSASPEYWIREWATAMGAELLATRLIVDSNGKITGFIEGKNCHGEEKVRRIRSRFDLSQYQSIHAYGDTSGDKPMLSLANQAHYKPFR